MHMTKACWLSLLPKRKLAHLTAPVTLHLSPQPSALSCQELLTSIVCMKASAGLHPCPRPGPLLSIEIWVCLPDSHLQRSISCLLHYASDAQCKLSKILNSEQSFHNLLRAQWILQACLARWLSAMLSPAAFMRPVLTTSMSESLSLAGLISMLPKDVPHSQL